MKLSIVQVSEAERGKGTLSPETNRAAVTALHEEGALILRGAFSPAFIDELYGEFRARYGGEGLTGMMAQSQAPFPNPVQKVGDGRFEIAMRMSGPFGHPALFANPILIN